VGGFPEQPRDAIAREVQLVACLPGSFVLVVEVRKEGVGYPDRAATVTVVVQVTGITRNALVGEDEGMRADSVLGRQAPDGVIVYSCTISANEALIDIVRSVVVEVE